jgi:hypothetical protein
MVIRMARRVIQNACSLINCFFDNKNRFGSQALVD